MATKLLAAWAKQRKTTRAPPRINTVVYAPPSRRPRFRTRRARNPFPFSREPEAEAALYRDLAARSLIPVPAWQLAPEPEWDRPFAVAREERARALRL